MQEFQIEPEGNYTNEMYISGMSSSLPEDVQIRMYRSVPGLEHSHIVRNAYVLFSRSNSFSISVCFSNTLLYRSLEINPTSYPSLDSLKSALSCLN